VNKAGPSEPSEPTKPHIAKARFCKFHVYQLTRTNTCVNFYRIICLWHCVWHKFENVSWAVFVSCLLTCSSLLKSSGLFWGLHSLLILIHEYSFGGMKLTTYLHLIQRLSVQLYFYSHRSHHGMVLNREQEQFYLHA